MIDIFLSASVPDPRRNPIYYDTADLVAIRDSVRAFTSVVLPHAKLHWGGHPAITPLVRVVAESMRLTNKNRVCLYQSAFFPVDERPRDNTAFENVIITDRRDTQKNSLALMRQEMLKKETKFRAGVFIGGMEGVEEEFELFRELQPQASVIPIASTGAAAKLVFDKADELGLIRQEFREQLKSDFAYASLFRVVLALPGGTS